MALNKYEGGSLHQKEHTIIILFELVKLINPSQIQGWSQQSTLTISRLAKGNICYLLGMENAKGYSHTIHVSKHIANTCNNKLKQ